MIVTTNNIKYIIKNPNDCIQRCIMENKQWENHIFLLIEELIKKYKLKHFLNIGAHIGTISMPVSKIIEKVTAIEAYPPTFSHLQQNIELNEIKNIDARNVAVGDVKEVIHFTSNDERWLHNSGGMRVITKLDKELNIRYSKRSSDEISCQMYPLDDIQDIDNFDIMLVDIEGLEDRFLKGAVNKITKNKPVIIIEIWDDGIRKNEKLLIEEKEVIDMILKMGYFLYKKIEVDYVFLPNMPKNIPRLPKKSVKNNFNMSFV